MTDLVREYLALVEREEATRTGELRARMTEIDFVRRLRSPARLGQGSRAAGQLGSRSRCRLRRAGGNLDTPLRDIGDDVWRH
jgi:hypothetical protein